ncbi:MAG: hypothetical protein KDB27_32455, partial [Planctomycetales bacterium]|nr:hypothetical protein [Planctomycetales bacterium]
MSAKKLIVAIALLGASACAIAFVSLRGREASKEDTPAPVIKISEFEPRSSNGREPSQHDSPTSVTTISGEQYSTPDTKIKPQMETWPSEVFTDQATAVLKKIKTAANPSDIDGLTKKYFTRDFTLTQSAGKTDQVYAGDSLRSTRLLIAEPTAVDSELAGEEAIR